MGRTISVWIGDDDLADLIVERAQLKSKMPSSFVEEIITEYFKARGIEVKSKIMPLQLLGSR